MRSRRGTKYNPPSSPLSKEEGPRNIGHNMEHLILSVSSVSVSYSIYNDSLLQNVTDILLQNATTILLQNAKLFTKCVSLITKCDVYYELRQSVNINRNLM